MINRISREISAIIVATLFAMYNSQALVAHGGRAATAPEFSPDSTKLVFVKSDASGRDVWLSNANGTNASPMTWLGSIKNHPSWAPDGSVIVLSSTRGSTKLQIWTTDPY